MLDIHHASYVILFFCISGICLLSIDQRTYKAESSKKEKRVTRWLGRVNLLFAGMVAIGFAIYFYSL